MKTKTLYAMISAMVLSALLVSCAEMKSLNDRPGHQDKGTGLDMFTSLEKSQYLKKFSSAEEMRQYIELDKSHHEIYPPPPSLSIDTTSDRSSDFSQTNVQEKGVDEADFIKNDGKYIYILSQKKLVIVDAFPAKNSKILSLIEFNGGLPVGIFVNKDRLVAFVVSEDDSIIPEYGFRPERGSYRTHAYIYDISDKKSPKLAKEFSIDGFYQYARMIDNHVYFIATDSQYYGKQYFDFPTLKMGREIIINPDVFYFDNIAETYVLNTIASFNIQQAENITAKTFLLSPSGKLSPSDNLYVSLNNMFINYQKNLPWRYFQEDYENNFYKVVVALLPSKEQSIIKWIRKDDSLNSDEKWQKISTLLDDMYYNMEINEREAFIDKIYRAKDEYIKKMAMNSVDPKKNKFYKIIVPLLPDDDRLKIKDIEKDDSLNCAEKWKKISSVLNDLYSRIRGDGYGALIEKISREMGEYPSKYEAMDSDAWIQVSNKWIVPFLPNTEQSKVAEIIKDENLSAYEKWNKIKPICFSVNIDDKLNLNEELEFGLEYYSRAFEGRRRLYAEKMRIEGEKTSLKRTYKTSIPLLPNAVQSKIPEILNDDSLGPWEKNYKIGNLLWEEEKKDGALEDKIDKAKKVYETRIVTERSQIVSQMFYKIVSPLIAGPEKLKMEDIENDKSLNGYEKWQKISSFLWDVINKIEGNEKEALINKISTATDEYEQKIETENKKTAILKISINQGKIEYKSKGEVPGYLHNQFSLDEYNGNLRVATTFNIDTSRQNKRYNNVYILDENNNTIGKLEKIALGEEIYSTRFIGNRLYMVTFERIDPFFVVDLSENSNPKILGELKIPGYSDYLHPYDDEHIIGIGKGAESEDGISGIIKLALFDVSDVENPKEIAHYHFGDIGIHSEALFEHKAFLFDKKKELLVMPVIEMGGWDRAYVFNLNPQDGFKLKGKICHYEGNEDTDRGGWDHPHLGDICAPYARGWLSPYGVSRSVFIDHTLYTVSAYKILMNDLNKIGNKINNIDLPQ